ncbi:MAG: phage tail tube protein [Alphaproteobacteria bacterium]|nr:phage tail tube protein [Alphaproteobacteria bacterium]
MSARSGMLTMIKIGSNTDPEFFHNLAGLEQARLSISQQYLENNHVAANGWRTAALPAGRISAEIVASGVYLDLRAGRLLRQCALDGAPRNYLVYFEKGDWISAKFLITEYQQQQADSDSKERFRLVMQSIGHVVHHTA